MWPPSRSWSRARRRCCGRSRTGPGTAGVFVNILFLAVRLPARAAIGLPVAAFVVLAAVAELKGLGIGGTVPVMAVIGGFFGMVFLANRLGEANEQAERLLLELEHSRAAQAQAAGLAERQRLAREMHDVLAHSLSGLMLQLEAARMLANAAPGDPRLPGAIDRAHHLGKTGLEEARRAIGMLRGDELPGPERLAALAFQFQRRSGHFLPAHRLRRGTRAGLTGSPGALPGRAGSPDQHRQACPPRLG